MIKKHLFYYALFALIILIVDLLFYYINHKSIDIEEIIKVLKILLITGVTVVPLQLFLEKKKNKK
jgi:hypothetical protein